MKALVKAKPERGLWLENVPMPECGPNDVRIKIKYNAICGTDVHIYRWDEWAQSVIRPPMVVGHEFVGEVAEVGSLVDDLKVGDRVSGEGHLVCGQCRNCRAGRFVLCPQTKGVGVHRDGAFAEYLVLPRFNVFALPDYVPDRVAAFFDAFGNATHTAFTFNLVGEDVLVTGAGPIGIMSALIAQRIGAKNVALTDVNPYRLDLARKCGVKHCYDVRECSLQDIMHDLDMVEGFDVALEMSGNAKAFTDLLDVMIPGGRIAMLGIPPSEFAIDWNKIVFKMLQVHGVYGRQIYETWYQMTSLIKQDFSLDGIITHEFGIDDFEKAFEIMDAGQSGRILLKW